MPCVRNPLRSLVTAVALAAVPIAAVGRADEADDQYTVAAKGFAQGQWKVATEEFQTFLDRYPNHPMADRGVFYLGESLLRSGDYRGAGPYYQQYLTRTPAGKFARSALFRLGEAAHYSGATDRAKIDLERFRSKYPNDRLNVYVLLYLGEIALRSDNSARAAKYFRDGLALFPQGTLRDEYRFRLAQALQKQKLTQEATQLLQAVVQSPRSRWSDDARYELGALQYAADDFDAAAETFAAFENKPLSDSPRQAEARMGRGWALMKLDRLGEAKAVFDGLVSDPKLGVEARFWLGSVLRQQEDWTAACEQFDLMIASAPAQSRWVDDAMYGKVWAALEAGDHDSVDRAVAEFENRFPDSPLKGDVQRMLAESLLQRKQYAKAVALLEPLATAGILDAKGLQDRYCLAEAYDGLKRYDDGLAVLLPVLDSATKPLLGKAQLLQGSLLVGAGRYNDAMAPLKAFLATGPAGDELVRVRGELAICYARNKEYDEARQAFDRLAREHPGHALLGLITQQLAEAAYAAGESLDDTPQRQRWAQWSTELFDRMRTDSGSDENELKGLSGVGWSQWKAGKLAEAAATFDELLQKHPPAELAAETALARGRVLQQLRQQDAALEMFELVTEKYPKSLQYPDALLAAARLYDQVQQDRESAKLYERLVKEYPEHSELDAVLYEWAWVLEDTGETAESGNLFEKLHDEHPQSRYWADATFRLAQRAYAAKEHDRAAKLTAEILSGSQDKRIREHALYLHGQIAVAKEDWQSVAETFRTLLKESPQGPRRLVAEYWVAETVYRKGEYREARKLFDELAPKILGRQEAWMAMVPLRRAQAAAQLDEWNEAYRIASKIEAEFPGFLQQYEVDYLVGRCLAMRSDFEGARKAYRNVLYSPGGEKTETAAMAQLMIAESYFHQKQYDTALKEYLRLHSLYAFPTWQSAALLQAGKCRDLLGEAEAADALYDRLIRDYPDTEFAKEARDRLATSPAERGGAGKFDSLPDPTRHEED